MAQPVTPTAPRDVPSSDDESSDDELLSYQPFCQESTPPPRSPGKDGGDEKDDDKRGDTGYDDTEERATRKVQSASLPPNITSASQLFWRKTIKIKPNKRIELYAPCRKCKPDEGFGLNLPQFDPAKKALIQYIEYPYLGQMEVVSLGVLVPYYRSDGAVKGESNDGREWSPHLSSMYAQQLQKKAYTPFDIRVQLLFLSRILRNVRRVDTGKGEVVEVSDRCTYSGDDTTDREVVEGRKGPIDFPVKVDMEDRKEDDACVNSDDDSVLSGTYGGVGDHKNELIRPGDVLSYYSHVYVKGDPRGLQEATVLSVDPKRNPILVLDNGDFLPKDTEVKRIKIMFRGKLKDHDGVYKRIDSFKLHKAPRNGVVGDAAAGILKESERLGVIIERETEKFQEKAEAAGFAPMDIMNKFKGSTKAKRKVAEGKPFSTPVRKRESTPSKAASQSTKKRKSKGETDQMKGQTPSKSSPGAQGRSPKKARHTAAEVKPPSTPSRSREKAPPKPFTAPSKRKSKIQTTQSKGQTPSRHSTPGAGVKFQTPMQSGKKSRVSLSTAKKQNKPVSQEIQSSTIPPREIKRKRVWKEQYELYGSGEQRTPNGSHRKQRKSSPHMTLEQLALAGKVTKVMLERWPEMDEKEAVGALSKETDIPSSRLLTFLEGDENCQIRKFLIDETETAVKEWLSKGARKF